MPKLFSACIALLLGVALTPAKGQPSLSSGAVLHSNDAGSGLATNGLRSPAGTGSAAKFPWAAGPTSAVLDGYIRMGLDSNLALKQRDFDLQRARLDLSRAQSLFYPTAGFSSQYTLANGGRTQSIPVGDLLNSVYSTLNQLTASNKFPQVGNQNIQFLPNDYHDTKMEVSLPLINPDLQYNRSVARETINARKADVDIYRRELVLRIRQAYYQYLQADKAVAIYGNALDLAKANRRVSQKFVENSMATREIVLRAQAQVSQVETSVIEAKNNVRNAAAYFNFLLNRSLDAPIAIDTALNGAGLPGSGAAVNGSGAAGNAGSISNSAGGAGGDAGLQGADAMVAGTAASGGLPVNREELARLQSMRKILHTNLQWDRSYLVPRLNAFYDIGFQGYGFHFDGSQFYQLAGLQLQWTLFKGGDNRHKIHQAEIDIESVNTQYRELTQQLTLQVQTAANDYYSALEALRSLSDEVASARETYRLAERRFNEGQALQIELIDARTQMTGAELRYSLGNLAVLNRAAELERVTAAYKF